MSTVIGAPISGFILQLEGVAGLHGWQWMFLLEALPALAMTFAVLFYLTDRPDEATWLTAEERLWLRTRLDTERAGREAVVHLSWFQSMVDWRVIALGFVYMGCNIPQYGLSFFLPQIVKAFGVSNVQAGFITALPYVVGAIGMVLWSRHSDRTGERKWHAVIALGAMVVGLMGAAFSVDPTMKMAWLCIAGFGFFSVLPIFWTFPTSFLSRGRCGGGHRRRQLDRQSRGLLRAAGFRLLEGSHSGRLRQPDLPGDLCRHRRGAGFDPRRKSGVEGHHGDHARRVMPPVPCPRARNSAGERG